MTGTHSQRTRKTGLASMSSPRTWRNLAMTATLALVVLESITAAPAPVTVAGARHSFARRDVKYVDPSAQLIEVTFQAESTNYVEQLTLNQCFNQFKLPLSNPDDPDNPVRNYTAITATDSEVALNFFLDDQCEEFDWSMQSQVLSNSGSFASVKYIGQFLDAKPGMYEIELSPTVLPDQDPDGKNHTEPVTLPTTATSLAASATGSASASATSGAAAGTETATSDESKSGTHSAGFAIGSGIVGILVFAGIIGACFLGYRKFFAAGALGAGAKRDGRFMSLSSGQDDYDDETGLVGENGPHSSALMQSRVGVSFDDERFDGGRDGTGAGAYSDDEEDEDDRVELGAYPQNPAAPTQYRPEPGTLPQNLRG
ncbi:hypothetical protein EMPS_04688 [Entomortierella parvispora]|uniref:Uncharacterized protein n=1 Tax=Entomortierella parvispora TaxID=205924 RepID=A0A9P3H928_9FUNG|nr:hypothetical protein EMPS_04688 [Entomortierella parvispora]